MGAPRKGSALGYKVTIFLSKEQREQLFKRALRETERRGKTCSISGIAGEYVVAALRVDAMHQSVQATPTIPDAPNVVPAGHRVGKTTVLEGGPTTRADVAPITPRSVATAPVVDPDVARAQATLRRRRIEAGLDPETGHSITPRTNPVALVDAGKRGAPLDPGRSPEEDIDI